MSDGRDNQKKALQRANDESNRICRESIEGAFIELLKTNSIDELTIQQIVDKAGVSRMAYYRNYSSKEDILDNIFDEVHSAIIEEAQRYSSKGGYNRSCRAVFEAMNKYVKYREGSEVIINAHESERFLALFSRAAEQTEENNSKAERYCSMFWAGAIFNVMTYWIKTGMHETPEEIEQYCRQAALQYD